jgi:hypothetical protein
MKGKNIKIEFNINDRLVANRRASRMIEMESGVFTPKSKVHRNKKVYNRKHLKLINLNK